MCRPSPATETMVQSNSDILLVTVAAFGLLAAVVLVVLLARERGITRRLRAELERRAALTAFEPGEVYTLLAAGGVEVGGETQHFGVVRLEEGDVRTFLTDEDTSVLGPGDTFSSVRGRPVRLDGPVRSAADTPTVVAPPEPDEEEDAGDRTRLFQPQAKPAVDDGFGRPYLEVIAGPDTDRRFALGDGSVRIGRDPGNEVALGDDSASRVHCHVVYTDGRYRLRDNHSTNGTLLNGERTVEGVLDFDDRIQLAETEMRFSCEGFDLKDSDPARAIAAFERCLERTPDLLPALRLLAFLLERDVARRAEAEPLWTRISRLEGNG